MTLITFVDPSGQSQSFEAESGSSLMEVAVRNAVSGIVGECGGSCACGSCHIYVADEWIQKLPAIGEMEREMLEFTLDTTQASRLGCQIVVSDELDGLTLTVPRSGN